MKEFTCVASSAAADLARARNLSVSGASQCPLRSEGTEAGCVAAKRVAMCQLRPKPAEPLPTHGGDWREV